MNLSDVATLQSDLALFLQHLSRSRSCLDICRNPKPEPKSEQFQVTEARKEQLSGLRLVHILVVNLIAPGFNAARIASCPAAVSVLSLQ